ncbi:BUD13 homolog [Eumeta japonica]|uniref:BUD13 homolog n=1 Tax=Eumeta variegata TaxID=151549 RepID=A0A4C1XK97_EUMVA|nr:BUD13 homolog [Eumeta japonica]
MTTTIDQKTYLQKYLDGSSGDKKKKKKKTIKGKGLQIIDDDLDLSKLRPLDGDELDILGQGEDAPQIAGIIDERPEELRAMEEFKTTSKWRVINQDDGFNSNLKVEEIKKTVTESQKENTLIFGKMYSDSEDEKNDVDLSPPRKTSRTENSKHQMKTEIKELDKNKSQNSNNDSDISPLRKKSILKSSSGGKERIRKPSRWGANVEENRTMDQEKRSRHKSTSSDSSPPRKSKKNKDYSDSDTSLPRKKYEKYHNKSISKTQINREFDSRRNKSHRDLSSSNKKNRHRRNSDSDLSPPRKSKKESPKRYKEQSNSPPRKSRYQKPDSDSDLSPPRIRSKNDKSRDSNRSSFIKKNSKTSKGIKSCSDSDLSPPRRKSSSCNKFRSSDTPPPSNKKMAKTLEGKKAGLQSSSQLREENDSFRKREEEVFRTMTDDVSGRNAQVVSRRGGKRETSEEKRKQQEKAEKQKRLNEQYEKWSKGLKQVEDQERRIKEYMEEANKPFARHKDDSALEGVLRAAERDGDPMLEYMRDKKTKENKGVDRPVYKGNYPPNRFNIRPGYRWDGVDRSNGYEQKLFQHQTMRKAQQEEAYKWSTEDL